MTAPAPGGFTPVTPARILDTRIGVGAPATNVGPGQSIDVQVTGTAGVPATGAAAVSLNVTVTQPTAVGHLTVYPTGEVRPLASNANFVAGQTVANAVVVKIGAGGKVTIFNSSGASHLVADVAGWHATARDTGDPFTAVAPVRLFDSRATRAIGPGGSVTVRVADGRPATLTAVALNVTATEPSIGGHLTVYPSGTARPLASNLNVAAGQTRANFVAVKVAGGAVDIYNSSGTTQVVVDLLGYWSPGSESRMTAITPTRILDTRNGHGFSLPIGSQDTFALHIYDGVIPTSRTAAVVLNVTATRPTAGGYLTVTPKGVNPPLASNLNFVAGETVPNLVVVPVGAANNVNIYNSNGQTDLVVDIVGWFDIPAQRLDVDGIGAYGSEVTIDPASRYAYISNRAHNRIEVLRLADGVLEDPILVGSQPMGLDLTPDGRLLYVANRGSSFVSVVDVMTRTELRRFPIPSGFMADTPYSIAVLANGKALLTTTFYGSGFGSYMLEIDLATDAVTLRSDFFHEGRTTEITTVRASGDRKSAVVAAGNISSGPVSRYDATTDAFAQVNAATFTSAIATNLDGSVTLVNRGSLVYDREMRLLGTVPGCGTLGVAVNAAGTVGYALGWDYRVERGFIAVCDLVRFRVTRTVPLGPVDQVGRLQLSPDGRTLVGIIDTGLVLFRV